MGAACVIFTTVHSLSPPDVSFDFLAGKVALSDETSEFGWRMDGLIACGHGICSDDGPAVRQRTKEYVYKADYKQVIQIARAEAFSKGGKEYDQPQAKAWEFPDGTSLWVCSGKYDPVSGITDEKLPYVRVTVSASKEEGWAGVGWRWVRSLF